MGLAQQLRELDDERLAKLLLARADLLDRPAPTFEQLAGRAAAWNSQARALADLDLFSHHLIELVALAGRSATVDDVTALAGPTVRRDQVEAGLRRLHDLALLSYNPPQVKLVGDIVNRAGGAAGIGAPAERLLPIHTVDVLSTIARHHGIEPAPGGRRLRKPDLVAAITERLGDFNGLAQYLAHAPSEVRDLLIRLDDAGLYTIATYDPTRFGLRADPHGPLDPVRWLLDRGLLVETSWGAAELVAEVTLALRGGILFPGITPDCPPLVTTPLDPAVDLINEAGQAASRLLDLLVRVLQDLAAEPAPALKAGGVGVRVVKRIATLTQLSERDAALLIEVAAAAGLLDRFANVLRPSNLFESWLELDPADRWLHVFRTWRIARAYPRAAGSRDQADKPVPPLSHLTAGFDAPPQRQAVLLALLDTPANHAVEPVHLADRLVWLAPHRWAGAPIDPQLTVQWFVQEARFIGALVLDALVPAARLELSGNFDAARQALVMGMPEPHNQVILQADLTALAMGALDPSLAGHLGRLAEVESRGSATVYRFSQASLGRAIASGTTPSEILTFLDAHSPNEVPQTLRVLIEDVGRRYGRARVGPATSYLRCDEEALLTELVRHRRLAKLGLRTIAPTVAVSSASTEALVTGLLAAGYLPAEEDSDGQLVVARPPKQHRLPLGHLLAGPTWTPPDSQQAAATIGLRGGSRTGPKSGEAQPPLGARADALIASLRAAPPGPQPPASTDLTSHQARQRSEDDWAEEFAHHFSAVHDGSLFPHVEHPYGDRLPDDIGAGPFDDVPAPSTASPRDFPGMVAFARRDRRAVTVIVQDLDDMLVEVVGRPVSISPDLLVIYCAECREMHDIPFAEILGIEVGGLIHDDGEMGR